jgi:hypothetical protein
MRRLIQRSEGVKLLIEFWPWGLEQAGSSAKELLDLLNELGFDRWEIRDGGALVPATDHRLLEELTPGSKAFTNLFCFRPSSSAA